MKNLLRVTMLAICAIFMVANVSAQVITAERASEIANQFFANGKQKSAAFRSTNATLTQSIDSRAVTGESNDAPTFHILTGADGKGFVIVSGEETENPIIGYSFDGTIDTNNLPDGFVDYMTDIDAQVRALREYNAANPQKADARSAMQKAADYEYNATSMGNIVKNLNTAPWGQHGPFNNLCKTTDGQTALTGCGPTAFAILCYYYKWPASGVGTVTHQGTGENMELGHTYDYASMRNDDYRSGYTEAEANAVAVLMRDLGWANQVGYGTSSTSYSETAQHMVDHFRFKSVRPVDHGASLAVVRSTLGNDTQWKTYIKNSLDAGYPIPYASTTDASNSGRHIYILDGYTDNDYYHFNWGWSGQGNGWFTLDNMVPDDYSNYSNSHKAYYIIPDATTYAVTATVNDSNMGTVSINNGTAGSTATANLMQGVTATLTAHPADGYALASWTKNGVVVGSRSTLQVPVGTDANDYVANFDDEANVLVVKEYTVNPANGSLSSGTSKYSTWTSTDTQPALTLKATNASGAAVYAISALSSSYKAYATAYDSSDKAHTNITYTLSVPEGYVITNYLMTYNVGTAGQISLNGELLNATGDHTLSAAPNAQTASFTLSVPSAGQQYITVKSIAVTVQSEGGASTPTPDPEPEPDPTPATYAITTAANPAEGGTAKFAVGTGSQQTQGNVNDGEQITLYAVANTGYRFVNWTLNGTEVSTEATCNVTASQAANYVANFEPEAAEPELPITGTEVNATFAGATGFVYQGNTNQVVLPATQTAPAITFSANDAKIGYSTADGPKYPYLFKSTDFTISVPVPYKIAGYKLTVQGHNFNAGTFTYTVGTQNAAAAMRTAASARSNNATATATISGTTPLSVMATGLNTSEINIGVGSASAETAGIIVKELQLDLVQESQEPVEVSGDLEFTFTRNGSDVTVDVSGAEGVTATITATSPDDTNTTTTTGIWNTGGIMAERTDVLCTSTNTSRATEGSPITYTLTINGLRATVTDVAFTHVAVNSSGNLQPSDGTIRHCNFKLEANDKAVGTLLSDQNIWIPSGSKDKTIEFNDLSVAADGTLTIKLTIYRGTSNDGCYYGLKKITLTADPLAGKYFRLETTVNGAAKYLNVGTQSDNSHGNVNMVDLNESSDDQIFFFEQSGDGYKLKAKSGNYIKCAEWNVNANTTNVNEASVLLFEESGDGYLINWYNTFKSAITYFNVQTAKGGDKALHPYCDGEESSAFTWVLEEVVYYTVTATAGEGGSVSPLTSTIEQGKPVTLTATANEGYHFVNWTLNGNVVSTDESYTFNATATGEYVANFEISTYTISATANPGTAGSVTINGEAVSSKNVNENSPVTLVATPQAGYYFVNWTNGTDVVSTAATYTFTATADTNLEANFEQIVVDVVLTEIIGTNAGQTNVYRIRLDGFTSGITKETVAAKLVELYPYIALGEKSEDEVIDNGKLQINGNSYTYTNNVILPFKVSNAQNEIWHNIYWPSNTSDCDYPVYLSASDASDTYVSKVTGNYAYGDHPTYNTSNGNNKISWAIYNVNNGFEFIFKNKDTGKYIQVTSVANGDAQNVVYVENATDATVFTIEKKPAENDYDTDAQYSLTANVGEEKGYLCSTSATGYNYATHYNSNGHQGAWFEFVESPYYEVMLNDTYAMYYYYAGVGEGKCIITDALVPIVENLGDYEKWGGLTYNTINAYAAILEEAWRWPAIKLNIKPAEGGTTSINGEENVTKKKAPIGYQLPLVATPAVGYHFENWSDSTSTVLSENAEYTTSTSGTKNWVTNINVNFAINIYNISVTAGEGGSASASAATAEHGSEVTLTAEANDGYEFDGWYNGEEFVNAEANYTFTVTSDINYTARFSEAPTGTVAIHITVASTDGTTVTNAVDGNVKAIIDGIGQEWATDADFVADANVALSATSDHNDMAYLFDGWYKNGVLVSTEKDIVVKATETATYEARFFRGCVVIGNSNNIIYGRVMGITLADGTTIGYDTANRAVVKAGTTVKINTINIKSGYEVGSWIDTNDEVVGTDNSLIVEVNNDMTYTAIFEPASYNLTVRANDDSYGTVTAESGTATGTTVKVGHNMEATITATANTGYYFVNWTKGTDVVSTNTTYTVPAINEVNNLVDVEYIANFLPVENATAGTYYRIAYDFPAPAAAGAARAGATRAVGEELVYEISPSTGTPNTKGGFFAYWVSNNNPQLRMDSKANSGNEHERINTLSNGTKHSLVDGTGSGVVFTVSAPDGYVITGYSISGVAYGDITLNGSPISHNKSVSLSDSNLEVSSFSFTIVGGMNGTYKKGVDINSFEVTIIAVAPNTARYYMQSEACGVSGGNNLQNALKMTKDTTATSIFYYADSKLLSYDKGTYIKEDVGTRGLQEVGVSGTVTITTSGETATISAPNYMHANTNGTTYYADHCGSDNGDVQHNFVLEEVTTLPVTISSALHATFYAPVAVAIPDGVTAYVLKAKDIPGIETYAWMTSLKNGIIPANTGVIIKGTEGTYYFDIVEDNDEARLEAEENVLEGTVAKTKITHDAYILAKKSNGVGLYPVAKNSYLDNSTDETTVRFTNNSHKAYLPVTDDWFGEQLKKGTGFRFVYDDEETTGIDEFETEESETIYDLQGRKLSEITEPGIYIVNGKKVWVK